MGRVRREDWETQIWRHSKLRVKWVMSVAITVNPNKIRISLILLLVQFIRTMTLYNNKVHSGTKTAILRLNV